MERPHSARFALVLLLGVSGGCTSWETSRANLVEPIDQLVHRDYPRAVKAGDPDRYAGLFSEGARSAERAGIEAFWQDWHEVLQTSCVIDTVEGVAGGRRLATVTLRVDGLADRPGHPRRTYSQRQYVVCERTEAGDGGAAWRIAAVEQGPTQDLIASDPGAADEVGATSLRFAEVAAGFGVDFVQESCGVEDERGVTRDFLAGSGLAVGDLDGDGAEDLVLVGGLEIRAYMNRGGRFVDESAERGFEDLWKGESRFPAIIDLDGDGDRDVFVGVLGEKSRLYENLGDGHFLPRLADDWGITSTGEHTGVVAADFDQDGDVDLFVSNGGNLMVKEPKPVQDALNATANQMFVNDGNGRFHDIAESAGLAHTGWALTCTGSDYDQDGDVDLFVANDFGFDRLFRNDGDWKFTDISSKVGIAFRGSSMGGTFGDADGDGDLDLFVTGMASNAAWIIDQPGYPIPAPWPVSMLFGGYVLEVVHEMFHGNRLYLNRGDGTFDDVSEASGTRNAGWAWGGIFLDYDNDSHLDLYVTNGLISGELKDDL